MRFLFISVNLTYGLVWNTVLKSDFVLLATTRI